MDCFSLICLKTFKNTFVWFNLKYTTIFHFPNNMYNEYIFWYKTPVQKVSIFWYSCKEYIWRPHKNSWFSNHNFGIVKKFAKVMMAMLTMDVMCTAVRCN